MFTSLTSKANIAKSDSSLWYNHTNDINDAKKESLERGLDALYKQNKNYTYIILEQNNLLNLDITFLHTM